MDGQGKEGGGADGGAGSECDVVGRAFVEYYYQTFDANRGALASLYGGTSVLSFEGHRVAGAGEIGLKLAQLPFEQCRHSICTIDCQPTPSFPGGILVFVSGNLQLAGEEHQLRFSQVVRNPSLLSHTYFCVRRWGFDVDLVCVAQMFQLVPNEQGSFFVQNDIFRLNYG